MNGDAVGATIDEAQLQSTSEDLFKLLTAIGILVIFIVGTIIGIQFMIASVEDKAKVKETLVPYVIGCAVILGAFTIWSIVVNTGQKIMGPELRDRGYPSSTEGYTEPSQHEETYKEDDRGYPSSGGSSKTDDDKEEKTHIPFHY